MTEHWKKFGSFICLADWKILFVSPIYIDRDHVEFTQGKIYSNWDRLHFNNFYPL